MTQVDLFIPCYMDQFFPETAFNTVKLLQKAGCNVMYNPDRTCCGQMAYNAGHWDVAKSLGEKFLSGREEETFIVTPSTLCLDMVKRGYDDLFTNSAEHNTCRMVQSHVIELTEFLVHVIQYDFFGAELIGRAVYHDSCTAINYCGIYEEPRKLLKKVGGLELIEFPHSKGCCGFGGVFSSKYPDIAQAIAAEKIEQVLQVEADYIISTDMSCLFQLNKYIQEHNIPLKTMHIADVLAHGWANV